MNARCRISARRRFHLAQPRNVDGPEVPEEVEALVAEQLQQLPDAPVLDGRVELHHPHHGPEPVSAAAEQPSGAELLAGVGASFSRRRRHPAMSRDGFGSAVRRKTVRLPVTATKRRREGRRRKTRQQQGGVHGAGWRQQEVRKGRAAAAGVLYVAEESVLEFLCRRSVHDRLASKGLDCIALHAR